MCDLVYFGCRCFESQIANAACWPERSLDWNGIKEVFSCSFVLFLGLEIR